MITSDNLGGAPLVICYGVGQDSTGLLVGLRERNIVPDLILFADVGAERKSTYEYLPIMDEWLADVGFPPITTVRYQPKDFKHWPPYHTIEENILTNCALASISYGRHNCSSKWKIQPQATYLKTWEPAVQWWAQGKKIIKAIGFDAKESHRSQGCSTYAVQDEEGSKCDLWYPLQEWGWTRDTCIEHIKAAGLPVPTKSSCYFCAAMKPWEVDELAIVDPEKLQRLVIIEARTAKKHLDYAREHGWPRGENVPLIEGIWRRRVKGMRGATPKPGSMTEYIRDKQLLPAAEIARLIEATPTEPLYVHQIVSWQAWLHEICHPNTRPADLEQIDPPSAA